MKKHLKTLLPIVLVIALALALSIAVFASGSTNEAKIGDTEYATLEEAVEASNASASGETIVLLKDINRTVTKMGFTKSTTIDLNGHTVSAINPANKADPLMAVGKNATLKLIGKGTLNINQRFLQISSNNDGARIVIEGTDSGIVINHNSNEAAMMLNSGDGAELTNTHFYATQSTEFFQISSGTVAFNDSTLVASNPKARLFSYKKAGVKFVFNNTYACAGKQIFVGNVFSETDENIKVDNPADFVMLDAKNSFFHAPEVSEASNITAFGGKGKIRISGTMNFDNCELMAYRIFENGAGSGVTGLNGGEFEDGYTLNINCTNSTLQALTHTNSGQIVRGYANYRFENCNLGLYVNGGLGGFTSGEYITVINCHFSRNVMADSTAKSWLEVNSLKEGDGNVFCYDATNTEFPYYLCEESKKPVVQPSQVLFNNLNMNIKDRNPAFPLIGTSTADKAYQNATFGGRMNIKLGRLDAVSGINGSFLKYTVTDLDGNIPATPTQVTYNEDPYFILGDIEKATQIALNGQKTAVIEFDIMLENFGTSKFSIAPQIRTSGGTGAAGDSFNNTSGSIDGKAFADFEWHHIQLVISVNQTTDAGNNLYRGSTYQLYIDGVKTGDARYAVKTTDTITDELFVQGARISIRKDHTHTTGASISVDNIFIHTYTDENAFIPGVTSSDNGRYMSAGNRLHSLVAEGQSLNIVTDRTVTAENLKTSLKSGIFGEDAIYTDFKGFITDKSALPAGNKIGEQIFVHGIDGTTASFYATYSDKTSGVVAYDTDGKPYMGADSSAEFKTLFETIRNGETAKLLAEEFILDDSTTAYLQSTTAKTVNFDLAGNTLSKIRKSLTFSSFQNITFNLYSSLPGGVINSRGIFDNSVNPSDAYYNFNTNFGGAMFYVSQPNATINLGKYGSYPGENLTVTGAFMIDIAANVQNTSLNIDGGTYIRTVHDSIALIGARAGTNAAISIKNANLLSGEASPAPLFSFLEGSTATLTVEKSTVFMPMPTGNDATAKPLFDSLSTTANVTFKNTGFSNVSFTPNKANYPKVKLGTGCMYSESCDISNVDFGENTAATLKGDWKQTLANGSEQLIFNSVAGQGSVTYHYYKNSTATSGKYLFVWTGDTATDGSGNTVPSGSFTAVYGDISAVCDGDATNGYTLKSGCYYGSKNGIESETVSETYLVSTGVTVPDDKLAYVMPDMMYIVLAEGQRIVTWEIGESSTTEVRDADDDTAPSGFELPVSKADVYAYTWNVESVTDGGVQYETRTVKFEVLFKLKSNISLNNDFKYNIYIPKALVEGGDVNGTILLNGNEVTLKDLYIHESVEYYIVSVNNIAAPNGGDSFEVITTLNLADDAIEATDTIDTTFTLSIPEYSKLVLEDNSINAECKQMMIDVLNYVRLAAVFGGDAYTAKAGYAAVNDAIALYGAEGITATDTSTTDFAALAKTPQGVKAAVDAATFEIGSSVKMRLYLSEDYNGTLTLTYKDKASADVVTDYEITDGKYYGKNYVELNLKAYYIANDVTITFDGQTDAANAVYNLASYIEYYKDNAKVADLAKALYAYSLSALAYQNTLG